MNVKEKFTELISAKYPLTRISDNEYSKINIMGMDFITESYDAKGFGRFSWMSAEGMNGAMKMDTVVFNAFEKDMPMFSYDRIKAMGKDTLIAELYDTMLSPFDTKVFAPIKEKLAEFAEMPSSGARWYDAIRYDESAAKVGAFSDSDKFDEVIIEYLEKYLELADSIAPCDKAQKMAKAGEYSTNLVEQGGMAADNFIKVIGVEKTKEFFRTLLFGA